MTQQTFLKATDEFWARVYADFVRDKIDIYATKEKKVVVETLSVAEFREKYVVTDQRILT